ncbi:MAG: HlyD family efflux transporter periplasmic adaptor subunit [Anaerolineae bacterium]|nr:HlyD family efflux transporter periplasmic adaptor subunit [Anaerolineae bacterium]
MKKQRSLHTACFSHRLPSLLVGLLAVVLIAACSTEGAPNAQIEPTSTPIPTAPAVARPTYLVQLGDVREELTFTGRWQPRDQLPLSFETAGAIRQVNVQRGDTVIAGQLLADYQIDELENQLDSALLNLESAQNSLEAGEGNDISSVADAEINLANARLQLESTRQNIPWTSVANARISLDEAERAVDRAQRAYDDARSHPEQPASTTTQALQSLEDAKTRLRSAENSYFSAAQSYNNYMFQIKQQENAVITAELRLEEARSGASDPSGQQSLRSAQLQVDQIREQITSASLFAPIDGVVLEVSIQPGDQVQAFDTVITIGQPEPKEAVASLAIGDAQRLSVGLVGECQVINQPETAVQCVVRQIPLSARDADQSTRVAASLEEVPLNQLVEVRMPLEVRENVLWLPPAAIRTFQNRTFVVLETPDGPRSVDVEIGLQTDERVEIISGVQEGDVVQGP